MSKRGQYLRELTASGRMGVVIDRLASLPSAPGKRTDVLTLEKGAGNGE